MKKKINYHNHINQLESKIKEIYRRQTSTYSLEDCLREIARWAVESCVPEEIKEKNTSEHGYAFNLCRGRTFSKAKELGIVENK